VRSELGQEALDGDHVTLSQRIPVPAAAHQAVGRPELEIPVDHVAFLIFDVDVDSSVRVRPFQLGHGAGQRDRLVAIEFSGE
jgi:hypothetical protein